MGGVVAGSPAVVAGVFPEDFDHGFGDGLPNEWHCFVFLVCRLVRHYLWCAYWNASCIHSVSIGSSSKASSTTSQLQVRSFAHTTSRRLWSQTGRCETGLSILSFA